MFVRLTMIRSGATPATRKGAFPLDEALEPRARALASVVGAGLRRADRVLTSPMLRARQTAEAMSLQASVEPLLAAQDHGRWGGKSLEAVHADDPEGIAAWLSDDGAAPHGGESLADVSGRVSILMDGLRAERGHTIAVTHAAIMRAAMVHVLGAPLAASRKIDIEPLGIVEFSNDGRRWMLRIARPEEAD